MFIFLIYIYYIFPNKIKHFITILYYYIRMYICFFLLTLLHIVCITFYCTVCPLLHSHGNKACFNLNKKKQERHRVKRKTRGEEREG